MLITLYSCTVVAPCFHSPAPIWVVAPLTIGWWVASPWPFSLRFMSDTIYLAKLSWSFTLETFFDKSFVLSWGFLKVRISIMFEKCNFVEYCLTLSGVWLVCNRKQTHFILYTNEITDLYSGI